MYLPRDEVSVDALLSILRWSSLDARAELLARAANWCDHVVRSDVVNACVEYERAEHAGPTSRKAAAAADLDDMSAYVDELLWSPSRAA